MQLPIANRSGGSPDGSRGSASPSKAPGAASRRGKVHHAGNNKMWADYTPTAQTPWGEHASTPWESGGAGMGAPYGFGSGGLLLPPNMDQPTGIWPATPTPSGGAAGSSSFSFGMPVGDNRTAADLVPPPPPVSGGMQMQMPPRFAAMAAAAAAAAAGAAAAAAAACDVNAASQNAAAGGGYFDGNMEDTTSPATSATGSGAQSGMRTEVKNTFIHVPDEECGTPFAGGLPNKSKTMPDILKRQNRGSSKQGSQQQQSHQADADEEEEEEEEESDGDADVHALGSDEPLPAHLPSRGSSTHGSGKCRPCAWFWKPQKCLNARECGYCHLCPEGELKARKKTKVTAMRMGALVPRAKGADRQQKASGSGSAGRVMKLSMLV
eukprot:TRINITY_DN2429_c0_g2_i1.p1 TRINITY_DN2429_c0_g2~~TRINITY_DN2429_c0_g2_i1.p1  ORF type:complete len:380 (-),score=94.42 TRINITY_DN2429_c0_g2_i1:253-1392(-)